MKKILLTLTAICLAHCSVRAELIFYEGFNYVNGSIIATGTNNPSGTTNWFRHGSNAAVPSDAIVANNQLQVSATGGTLSRQDDIHRPFTSNTNSPIVAYASFTLNCTNLPSAAGAHFAHFMIRGTTTFFGRVWARAGTLPGTYQLGVSGGSSPTTPNKVYPADLSTNVDYQVTIAWDPVTDFAVTLWVNPIASTDTSIKSSDASSALIASAFAFRQPTSFGSFFCTISNLATATTFEEAATNVWSTNAVAPLALRSPSNGTNFVGDAVSLFSLAAGQGQGSLNYQWTKDGVNVGNANGNSNVLRIASAVVDDTGNYRVITTTPFGLSVTSASAFLWVTNAPVPPTISPTTNSTVSVFKHQATTLIVAASGPPTITYQWYYTNAPATGATVSGADTPSLTITDVTSTNGTAGAYYCVASNPFGSKTSGVFTVTAVAPPAVSVAYLRTLVDPVNYNATNAALRWQATGTVTTFTNLTTGNTSSYYLQDGTAGINIFVTLGSAFRPAQGDVLTFVGLLSSFNSTLELLADLNDPSTSVTVLSNNAALPVPRVIPFNITNNLALAEATEGRIVMLTNVFFGTNAGNTISTIANQTITVTNAAGEPFLLFFSAQNQDTAGQTLPEFAHSVIGPLTQNLNNTALPRNAGFSVTVTRFADIVTAEPPAVTLAVATGASKTLSWSAVPYNYSYSVLAAQPSYQTVLSAAEQVPVNGSTATGVGSVVVSPDGSSITVNMSYSGLSGAPSGAHIHGPAAAGVNADVIFGFSGLPGTTSGSIPQQTFALNATQAGYLHNGLLYINLHSGSFPGGEIRGQLRLSPTAVTGPYVVERNFQAAMLGVAQVPANISTATGAGTVVLSPDQTTITVNMNFAGLTTPTTAAHIHGPAGAGTNAGVIFGLSGVPAATAGAIPEQSFAITPTQVGQLQTGQLYFNIHNATYPGGEIRGQILLVPSSGLTFPTANGSYLDKKDSSPQKYYRVSSP